MEEREVCVEKSEQRGNVQRGLAFKDHLDHLEEVSVAEGDRQVPFSGRKAEEYGIEEGYALENSCNLEGIDPVQRHSYHGIGQFFVRQQFGAALEHGIGVLENGRAFHLCEEGEEEAVVAGEAAPLDVLARQLALDVGDPVLQEVEELLPALPEPLSPPRLPQRLPRLPLLPHPREALLLPVEQLPEDVVLLGSAGPVLA